MMKINSHAQEKTALQVCTSDLKKFYIGMQEEKKDQPMSDRGWKTLRAKWDWKNLRKHLGISRITKKMFPLATILEASSLENALWALGAVHGHRNAMRLLACYYAKKMLPIVEKRHPDEMQPLHNAIGTAESYARGQVGEAELTSVRKSLWAIINTDKNVYNDEDGGTTFMTLKAFHDDLFGGCSSNLNLKYAQLSALATVRVDIGGGVRRAAEHATDTITYCALDALDEDTAIRKAVFDKSADVIAELVANAVDNMANDAIKASAGLISNPPSLDAIRIAAKKAVREAICDDAEFKYRREVEDVMQNAVKKDFAAEFLKFCRLEDEYGQIKEF